MFTLGATPITFIGLIAFFSFCTLWCLYDLTRPQDTRQRVSNVLHLAMAVVMLAMVPTMTWSVLVGVVGIPVLVGIFGASTLWFAWLALSARDDRASVLHHAGHATMFAAMTWHLGAMMVKRAAMIAGQAPSGGMTGMGGTATPIGHATPGGMGGMGQSGTSGIMMAFAVVGVPFMVYLLAAGVQAVRRAAAGAVPASAVHEHAHGASCHEDRPVGSPRYRLAAVSDAAMNLGMFWMSTGLLVPLLPFMAVFAV